MNSYSLDQLFEKHELASHWENNSGRNNSKRVDIRVDDEPFTLILPDWLPDVEILFATEQRSRLVFFIGKVEEAGPLFGAALLVGRLRDDGAYAIHVWHELFSPWTLKALGIDREAILRSWAQHKRRSELMEQVADLTEAEVGELTALEEELGRELDAELTTKELQDRDDELERRVEESLVPGAPRISWEEMEREAVLRRGTDLDIIKHALGLALDLADGIVKDLDPEDQEVWAFCKRVRAGAQAGDLSAIRAELRDDPADGQSGDSAQ